MRTKKGLIYIANLPGGKKYVGHSNYKSFKTRKYDHYHHRGSEVTRKYKPKSINFVEKCGYPDNKCKYEEQVVVNNLIQKYGYDKVRGGRYTNSKNF